MLEIDHKFNQGLVNPGKNLARIADLGLNINEYMSNQLDIEGILNRTNEKYFRRLGRLENVEETYSCTPILSSDMGEYQNYMRQEVKLNSFYRGIKLNLYPWLLNVAEYLYDKETLPVIKVCQNIDFKTNRFEVQVSTENMMNYRDHPVERFAKWGSPFHVRWIAYKRVISFDIKDPPEKDELIEEINLSMEQIVETMRKHKPGFFEEFKK